MWKHWPVVFLNTGSYKQACWLVAAFVCVCVCWFKVISSLCSFIHIGSTASGQNETINWTAVVEVLMLPTHLRSYISSTVITSPVGRIFRRHFSCGVFWTGGLNLLGYLSLSVPLSRLQCASNKVFWSPIANGGMEGCVEQILLSETDNLANAPTLCCNWPGVAEGWK